MFQMTAPLVSTRIPTTQARTRQRLMHAGSGVRRRTVQRMRRGVVLGVVFAFVGLVAGSGAGAVTATLTSSETRTVRIAKAGLSVSFPTNWVVFTGGVSKDAAALKALVKANPKLRDLLNQQRQSADIKNIQFEAQDVDTGANLDVTVQPQGGFPTSLANLKTLVMPTLSRAGYTLLTSSARRVVGKPAYELVTSVPLQQPGPTAPVVRTRLGQLLIPRGNGAIEIAVGASDDSEGKTLIDSILGSVR